MGDEPCPDPLFYRKEISMRKPEPERDVNHPAPFELIDLVLRTKQLERHIYLEARRAIIAWHTSVVGRQAPITLSKKETKAVKFVDRKMTEEEIIAALEWRELDDPGLSTMLNEMLQDGYRVTYSYDPKEETVTCTVMGKSATNPNFDLGMSTRHATARQATHLAMFKHYVLYDGKAWGETSRESRFG